MKTKDPSTDSPQGGPPARGSRKHQGRRARAVVVVERPKVAPPLRMTELALDDVPLSTLARVQIELVADGLANDVLVPVIVARGAKPGPVLGMTAAVHGNELNGIRVIQDLIANIDLRSLRGTLVGVTAVNVPGLHNHTREFPDGSDLNRIFPGRAKGNISEVYAHRIVQRIVRRFDYLVDLHTASFGRINSLYVRADMTDARCARMAYLQRPQIIVHNPAGDHTLRGAAMSLGIPAITVEIGDPHQFQPKYIRSTRQGLRSMLAEARMLPRRPVEPREEPVLCERSYWLYTDRGGLLDVLPKTTEPIAKGATVAVLHNAFGDVFREYQSPEAGVLVGKSVNPVGQTGARILHLGIVAPPDHSYVRARPEGAT